MTTMKTQGEIHAGDVCEACRTTVRHLEEDAVPETTGKPQGSRWACARPGGHGPQIVLRD